MNIKEIFGDTPIYNSKIEHITKEEMSNTIQSIVYLIDEYDLREMYRSSTDYISKFFTEEELLKENENKFADTAIDKIRFILIISGHFEVGP